MQKLAKAWAQQCPSAEWDMLPQPRALQGMVKAPQILSHSHLALEEAILLHSWVSGEGQPLLCSVGGQEWAPGFLTYLLLQREINTRRAAHTLVYSRGSWWSVVLGGLLTTFSSFGFLCHLRPPLCLWWNGNAKHHPVLWSSLTSKQGKVILGAGEETSCVLRIWSVAWTAHDPVWWAYARLSTSGPRKREDAVMLYAVACWLNHLCLGSIKARATWGIMLEFLELEE